MQVEQAWQCGQHLLCIVHSLTEQGLLISLGISCFLWCPHLLSVITIEMKATMHLRTHAYDSNGLHRIHALSRGNYNLLSLQQTTRSWIICLGICKQLIDWPYRRSRAGRNMFKKIHTIVTNHLIRPQTAQVCLENLAHVASSGKQNPRG